MAVHKINQKHIEEFLTFVHTCIAGTQFIHTSSTTQFYNQLVRTLISRQIQSALTKPPVLTPCPTAV